MNNYKSDIYDLLTATERIAVDQFCQNINNSNVDVYIVMSHKAVQLFNVLLDQNHISKELSNRIIISNQTLDYDQSYFLGKRIAVIDDIIISGTTISSTINRLISIGVSPDSIIVIALAIDKKFFAMDFRKSDGNSILYCNTQLDDPTCIELSYKISKVFSYYGLPYDVDFPEYDTFKAPDNDLSFLYNNMLWEAEIISNKMHEDGGIDAFVLFPNQIFKNEFWNFIGNNLDDKVHIKLRVYVINYKSGNKECRIIPMCLFNEISEEELDELYSFFSPIIPLHINKNTSDYYVSIFRYLQFFLSHHLYSLFCNTIGLNSKYCPKLKSIELLFGKVDGAILKNTLCQMPHSISEKPISNNIKSLSVNRDCHSQFIESSYYTDAITNYIGVKKNNDYYLNKMILSPFLWWYDSKEIPIRLDLKATPTHYINDIEKIKAVTKRLISGFSLTELNELYYDTIKEYDAIVLISLYLDRAIDEGIIVPTVYHNSQKKYLSRVYRHGEDLPFGIEDECRLLLFLQKLNQRIPNIDYKTGLVSHGIAEISFEKIIVMFYQMGLRKGNIFNRFLGFNNTRLIMPFLSLHGTVEGIINSQDIKKAHIYSEKDKEGIPYITWLSKWLIDNSFISLEKYYNEKKVLIDSDEISKYLNQNSRGCISTDLEYDIENIASMISEWYNNMIEKNQKRRFKEDAIALTSCSDIFIYASAIATEIHYFSRFWKEQVEKALSKYRKKNDFYKLLTENDEDKKQTLKVVQGLNSGRNKVQWYNSDKAKRVVGSVRKILADKGANIWYEIWNSVNTARKSEFHSAPMSIEDATHQAVGYLYFYSACYDCIVDNDFWQKNELPPKYNEYRTAYLEQCSLTSHLNPSLFSFFDDLLKINKINEKKAFINPYLRYVIGMSEDIVSSIEELVEANDINYTIMYKSSLIVDIKALDKSSITESLMCIWNDLDNTVKSQINFVVLNDNNAFTRCGIFYGNSRNTKIDLVQSSNILFSVYDSICKIFNARAYAINAILIPDTIPGHMYKHNIYKNIQLNFSEFIKKNIIEAEKYYDTLSNHQLVLAKTLNVSSKVDNIVIDYGWDESKSIDLSSSDSCYSNITVYFNKQNRPSIKNDFSYSVVRIVTENDIGSGLLVRTTDRIICVSCNHLFMPDSCESVNVSFDNNPDYCFEIKPIIGLVSCNYSNGESLSAEDEIALFLPQWEGRIPFEIESIVSFEDLLTIEKTKSGEKCICCGFPDDGPQKWSDSFNLIYPTTNGYYQIKIPESSNSICSGYSGGIIVSEQDRKIIGIHEGRYGTDKSSGLIIPSDLIIKKINETKKDMER